MIVDPPAGLTDFAVFHGVRVTSIGEEGEELLALGHLSPVRAAAAMNAFARRVIGLKGLSEYMADSHPMELFVHDLEWRWARLCTVDDCESRQDHPEDHDQYACEMCDCLADGSWWLRWEWADVEPDNDHEWFPVTLLRDWT